MSKRLPIVSGRQAAAALQRAGFELRPGRGKGSHAALWKRGLRRPLFIPDHDDRDRGTLKSILRTAEVSVEEFLAVLA